MTCKVRPLFAYSQQPGHRAVPLPIPPAESALRAAARAGFDHGERQGYLDGWRYGWLCGFVAGCLAGAAMVWASIELGRLIGGAP